jgi:hypothetical protein
MPRRTAGCDRRKERRLRRRGRISMGRGCFWMSTVSRRYPAILGPWRQARVCLVTSLKVERV